MSNAYQNLPEFYVLIESEQRDLEDSTTSGTSSAYAARSEKLRSLKLKLASETKINTNTISQNFHETLRRAHRPLYSRGHETHTPGADLSARPFGNSPIVSRGHLFTHAGARPGTGGASMSMTKPSTRDLNRNSYSRPSSPSNIINGHIESPIFTGGKFRTPLTNVTYTLPSTQVCQPTSSGYYPDIADNLLENTRFNCVGGFAQRELHQKTSQQDRKYLADRRKVTKIHTDSFIFPKRGYLTRAKSNNNLNPDLTQEPKNAYVDGIIYKIDYEPMGSRNRHKRPVSRMRTFK